MPDRRAPTPRPLSRRALLGGSVTGLAATVAVSGCDTGDDLTAPGPRDGATTSPGAGSGSPEPSEGAVQSVDETIVAEVTDGLLAALAVLSAARRTPALRSALTPLLRAHRRHLSVLEGDREPEEPAVAAAGGTGLRAVRRSELGLHALLVDGAELAESGALARLLASIAASVTQHLAVLPTGAES